MYEVIVGNIGTVYSGPSRGLARATFDDYANQSCAGYGPCAEYGRAADESVTMTEDGEPILEHFGSADCDWCC